MPNQTNAVSQRPGDDALYVCRVRTVGTPTSTALEFTAPNFAATWPPGFASGEEVPVYPHRLLCRDAVRGNAPVGGDLIGPDAPNHGGAPGAPDDDWNMLCFDGHVEAVVPGSAKHALYTAATVGVRTT